MPKPWQDMFRLGGGRTTCCSIRRPQALAVAPAPSTALDGVEGRLTRQLLVIAAAPSFPTRVEPTRRTAAAADLAVLLVGLGRRRSAGTGAIVAR
jgi:hypothetical protein